ncbi:sugar phosphate isomerase/epimerase family protein [Marinobacterium aestuariivivens]|uniref:Sugar phosphate isomerase/epimerase family protein n=1 Tax=Marinobacterium aestuariivivens TaxID=1698799 RepID=A0ABW2A7C7_9GAMM
MSWAPGAKSYAAAWDILQRAGNANLGLVIDSFHLLAQLEGPEDLRDIPAARFALVHLSDFAMSTIPALEDRIDIARHYRLYPGEGSHGESIRELVRFCQSVGYEGDYVFDVYNDKYLALSPEASLQHAIRSRQWILDGLE